MAIVIRNSNEVGDTPAPVLGGTVTTSTTEFKSGTRSWKIDDAAGSSFTEYTPTVTIGTTYYIRVYFKIGSHPSALMRFVGMFTSGGAQVGSLRINLDGTLRLLDGTGGYVGGASPVITLGVWHYAEMMIMIPASGNGTLGMRLDGTEIVAPTSSVTGNIIFNRVRAGKDGGPATTNFFIDDFALNDTAGVSNNTWVGSTAATVVGLSWNSPPTPAIGANVSGQQVIEVLTTDNSRIQKIDYLWEDALVNGVGATQLVAPYDGVWDTTTEQDGAGTLTARATQTDAQTTEITRDFNILNTSVGINNVNIKLSNTFISKPILVKIGGTFVNKPLKILNPTLPPTATFSAVWTSPNSGSTISGTTGLVITPSDSSRVNSILFERDSDGLDLGTVNSAPWNLQFNTSVLPNQATTLRATITYDTNQTYVIKRDFSVDNSVPIPPPSGTIRRTMPLSNYNMNDTPFRNGVARGSTNTLNFVSGTTGWVFAHRFVLDETITLNQIYTSLKAWGTSWWSKQPAPTIPYAMGTGGILNARIVTVTSTGQPRFTDSAGLVAEELSISPSSRYTEILNTNNADFGFTWPSGSDGPMTWFFKPRTASGGMPTLSAGVVYALCMWNTHSQPGVNYMSMNSNVMRDYIWPSTTPGIANWPALLKTGGNGRARSPNVVNNMDPDCPGAVGGMDPREVLMYSNNGGASFPFTGIRSLGNDSTVNNTNTPGAGSYNGAVEPSDDGARYPFIAWKKSGDSTVYHNKKAFSYSLGGGSGSNTHATFAQPHTLTHAWVYTYTGGAAGTVTVQHKRGATTIATATASGGPFADASGGMCVGPLSQNLNLLAGDHYIASCGRTMRIQTDSNSRFWLKTTADVFEVGALPEVYAQGVGRLPI